MILDKGRTDKSQSVLNGFCQHLLYNKNLLALSHQACIAAVNVGKKLAKMIGNKIPFCKFVQHFGSS